MTSLPTVTICVYNNIVASILIMAFEALIATMYQLLQLKTIRL